MNKNLKTPISVVITAHDEEVNINNLLDDISSQQKFGYEISEVLIACDGCEDKTEEIVRNYERLPISVFRSKQRLGQNYWQNRLLIKSKNEIVLFLEADTRIKGKLSVYHLVEAIVSENLALAYARTLARGGGKEWFETVLSVGDKFKDSVLDKLDYIHPYQCHSGKIVNKELMSGFYWPVNVPEDAYLYWWVREAGLASGWVKNALVLHKTPANLGDYWIKSLRFQAGKSSLEKYFTKKELEFEYQLPNDLVVSELIKYFSFVPVKIGVYMAVMSTVNSLASWFGKEVNPAWKVSRSTKYIEA